ncbi:MAG: hypothetical protein NUV92_07630 [Ignavibacteria bacterium]|jgi:hypothetical protein|nr:hypothetical protein [Ignavibacteria bacterium]MDH7528100.1 hypothetical protein [Ignavibacteria bacterium]
MILKLFALLLVSTSLLAQSGLEQYFESSDYYFNRQLLNPYGMKNLKDITPVLVENIFANMIINPARLTELESKYYFYIDYRGERKETDFYDYPVIPLDQMPEIIPEGRVIYPLHYFPTTRLEPEPRFSFGFITNPVEFLSGKLFVGLTYQNIRRYDSFVDLIYPILMEKSYQTSSTENNEMKFKGDIFSFFAGYKINEKFSAGFSFNGINYSRIGLRYRANNHQDTDYVGEYLEDIDKDQDYNHQDYTFGLSYSLNEKTKIGIKTGLLAGKVNQPFNSVNKYFYQTGIPDVSNFWDYSSYYSKLDRNFDNDGKLYYSGFDFSSYIKDNLKVFGYFNYLSGKFDFNGNRKQYDTNFVYNKSFYTNENYWIKNLQDYQQISFSKLTGFEKRKEYNGFVGLRIDISSKVNLTIGAFYSEKYSEIITNEPLNISRTSRTIRMTNNSQLSYYPMDSSRYSYFEDAQVELERKTMDYLYQIPLLFNVKVGDYGELMFLLNQLTGGGKYEENFVYRIRNRTVVQNDSTYQEIGTVVSSKNSGYKNSIYEANAICGFKVFLSSNFTLNVLIDPDLFSQMRIAQWWMSLEGKF